MTLLGYARVSTDDQHLQGQLFALEIAGCTTIYQETATGTKATAAVRPEFNRMVAAATAGDVIVTAKLDRIARSTMDLLNLMKQLADRGIKFRALNMPEFDTTTATGELMITMLGAIATFERKLMLERQKDGITRAKAEGRYKGRAPTARAQSTVVLAALDGGATRETAAQQAGVSVASVYRIQRAARAVVRQEM